MHLLSESIAGIDDYLAAGGGRAIARAVELGPDGTIDEITRSGLRGRGGGGFPTGTKWRGVASQPSAVRFVVANGAEGEPGTFKDRAILRSDAYQVIEGLIVAAFAIGAAEAYICLKRSYTGELEAVGRAITELQAAGLCRDCRISVVAGPDEYLFGEEKAMLEVIEGKDPLPRVLPPYELGLFAGGPQAGWSAVPRYGTGDDEDATNPVVVNNVETLAHATHILRNGSDWFRSFGTPETPGTVVCTVVGDTERAGVLELPAGTPLREVISRVSGGTRHGRTLKAVCSGVANGVITAGQLDVPVSFEGLAAIGSGLGSAGFIVYDDSACMVEVARRFSQFLHVESCGQCPACKNGSAEITGRLQQLEGGEGDVRLVDEIAAWLDKVTDGNRCYLPVEERTVVRSILQTFSDEVADHLVGGRCPRPRPLPFPKLLDIVDGRAILDEDNDRKLPDWTYAPRS